MPKPKSGFTLPGHKYTRPYNPLDKQLRYDKDTGEILEIHDKPTGKTDPIAVQHDVDYSVSKDDKRCKNKANRKMVKALDSVPYNERQWGHWLARNMIWRDFTRRRVIVNDVDEMWIWLTCRNLVNGTRGINICFWLLMFSVNMDG